MLVFMAKSNPSRYSHLAVDELQKEVGISILGHSTIYIP